MTAPQPATPGSDSLREEVAEAPTWVHAVTPAETQQDDEPLIGAEERATARRVVADWVGRGHRASGPIALDELRAGIATALAAAEQRGYERAQNECPPGGWESGL